MFSGITWDITAGELLSEAISFIMVFKQFLLLGAVVVFAPYVVGFFKGIIRKRNKAEG
jgi:hypothetical protein